MLTFEENLGYIREIIFFLFEYKFHPQFIVKNIFVKRD